MRYEWSKGLSADLARNLPAQPRWVRARASLTTLGSSGLTSCSFLPSNLSAVITETFLSWLPALRLASPLIPAECVECWTLEPLEAVGEEMKNSSPHGHLSGDHHTYMSTNIQGEDASLHVHISRDVHSRQLNQKSSLRELIESVHSR